jgi:hypothetical protein
MESLFFRACKETREGWWRKTAVELDRHASSLSPEHSGHAITKDFPGTLH